MSDAQIYRRQSNKKTILIFLAIAAALPLLSGGMFAGAVLALMVAAWLIRADGRVWNWPILVALATIVLLENIAFILGFFGVFGS